MPESPTRVLRAAPSGVDGALFALDRLSAARVRWACVLSLLANIILWRMVSAIAGSPPPPPADIEITRIVVSPKGVRTVKTVTRKQIAHRVARIHKEIHRREVLRPRPLQHAPRLHQAPPKTNPVKPTSTKPLPSKPQPTHQSAPVSGQKPPTKPASGHKILTADASHDSSQEPPVTQGSGAKPGENGGPQSPAPEPTAQPQPAPPAPQPQPQPAQPAPQPPAEPPHSEPAPTPRPTPKPEPTATPKPEPTLEPTPRPTPKPTPRPTPTEPPKPKGPTREAEATRQVNPEIPDELKGQDLKSSVRVRVEIGADGSINSVSLRGSSGNSQVDELALSALRRWRWKPALKDGEPVASTQYFRLEFDVH